MLKLQRKRLPLKKKTKKWFLVKTWDRRKAKVKTLNGKSSRQIEQTQQSTRIETEK